jgi:methionine salvage enolase-phosphatase E1
LSVRTKIYLDFDGTVSNITFFKESLESLLVTKISFENSEDMATQVNKFLDEIEEKTIATRVKASNQSFELEGQSKSFVQLSSIPPAFFLNNT